MKYKNIFIGLGSNIEPRHDYINQAIALLREKHSVLSVAEFIETEPWGFEADTKFLNTVLEMQSDSSPRELLHHLQAIEQQLGRAQKSSDKVYHSRTIDLDILYFDRWVVVSPELKIPHSEMYRRNFVLEPLCQIASDFLDPLHMKSVAEIYNDFFKIEK